MASICIYFQVHQPYRLRHYTVFDVGNNSQYFDHKKNRAVLEKVADKCYRPATQKLLELLKRHPDFKVSFSLSGVLVEQLEAWAPDVIDLFREMAATGRMEFLSETYYHSLSFLYSKEEFWNHVNLHREKIKKTFGVEPVKVFRNTELVFTNELAMELEKKGYKGVLAEGADRVLGWRSPNYLYRSVSSKKVKLLLKNYRLSDDVAFRFSEKSWISWPLTADTYANWLADSPGDIINLFMDYETMGEHQWEDTGIFEFLNHLPRELDKKEHVDYLLPSEAVDRFEPVGELDIHAPLSWADTERDLSAWVGNRMQHEAIHRIYGLREQVLNSGDPELIESWRRLQTSDHFYYMCTKWFADGDVHKYFNPYDTPYEAFINFANALHDLELRLTRDRATSRPLDGATERQFDSAAA